MAHDKERKPQHTGDREGADGWDEGQPGARAYGEGVTNAGPQSEADLGAGRGAWGSEGWGQYTPESAQGSDLGAARNGYGNTGGDNYGPGRVTRHGEQPEQQALEAQHGREAPAPRVDADQTAKVRDVQKERRTVRERNGPRSPDSPEGR